jgi:hypothetical protein
MKTFVLTQATKQHDVNKLHDAFEAASISPKIVQSTETESTFVLDDAVTDPAIQAVVNGYTFTAPAPLADLRQLAQNFRNAVTAATTVAQLKAALNQELMLLIRELARREIKDL